MKVRLRTGTAPAVGRGAAALARQPRGGAWIRDNPVQPI